MILEVIKFGKDFYLLGDLIILGEKDIREIENIYKLYNKCL